MPCACNIPLANAPTNEIWGPIVWNLLHGMAEYAGKPISDSSKGEENYSWIQLIKGTERILPCPTCREHYKKWLLENPPDMLKKMPYENQRLWIRDFFWALHNDINKDNKKDILPFASLQSLYKNINLRSNIKELETHIKLLLQHNGLSILSWQNWLNHYKKLQSIYGI